MALSQNRGNTARDLYKNKYSSKYRGSREKLATSNYLKITKLLMHSGTTSSWKLFSHRVMLLETKICEEVLMFKY